MAKAYKCDICGCYCDDVFALHGLSAPNTHNFTKNFPQGVADCCELCYDTIMQKIADMIKEEQP